MNVEDMVGPATPETAEEASPPRDGHPLLATIICCVLLILIAEPRSGAVGGPAEKAAYLLGSTLAGVAIFWGVAWFITIRRSSPAWQIGSLIAVTLMSALTGLYSMGAARAASQKDYSATGREMTQALANRRPMQAGANSGPMLRMSSAMYNGIRQDAADFKGDADKADLMEVIALKGVTPTSPSLSHCERLDSLAGEARTLEDRWTVHLAAAHSVGEDAVRANQITDDEVRGFERGVQKSAPDYRRAWELNAGLATQTAALCRLLHSRPWRNVAGKALFSTRGDLNAFQARMVNIRGIVTEQSQLNQSGREALQQDETRFDEATAGG